MRLLTYNSLVLEKLGNFLSSHTWAMCVTLAICFMPVKASANDPLPVPNPKTHGAFLLGEWDLNQPTLIMMLDPFCPYCIRSLQRRDQFKNYNVFLFWAPILGNASEVRVAEILDCEFIAEEEVISAVVGRRAPECNGKTGRNHAELNQAMAKAYNPRSVPAYYFGGRRVGLSQLNRYVNGIASLIGNVSLDWKRYTVFKVSQPSSHAGQVGVILPNNFQHWDNLLKQIANATQLDWHVIMDFQGGVEQKFCEATNFCSTTSLREFRNKREELMALFGLSEITTPQFILNGKLLNNYEAEKVLGVGKFSG